MGLDNRGFTVVCLCTDTSGHMSGAHAMQQCMSVYSALAVCTNLTLWAPCEVALLYTVHAHVHCTCTNSVTILPTLWPHCTPVGNEQ